MGAAIKTLFLIIVLLFFAVEARATSLSDAVAGLSAGAWTPFTTSNFNSGAILRPPSTGSSLEYHDKEVWNPVNSTVMSLGGAHCGSCATTESNVFAKYTESNNTWSTLTNPSPDFDDAFTPSNSLVYGIGHAYHHNTINTNTGDYYHRQYATGKFMKFSQSAQTWSQCTRNSNLDVGGANVAGALEYFPDRNSLVYLDGAWGVWELSLASGNCLGSWVHIASTIVNNFSPNLPIQEPAEYHNQSTYSSLCHCIVMGGGNGYNGLYRYKTDGTFATVATPPAAITQFKIPDGSGGTILTADPVSGLVLVWKDSTAGTTMYTYNPVTDVWATISRTAALFPFDGGVNETVAIPISTYGVIMFVQSGSSSGGNVYLYKHAAGAADTTAPTAPSNLTVTAISSTQLNLSWTASTDAVGVTGYRVERCTSAGCANFVQVYTPTTNSQSDTGLTPSTLYRYQVRATDAAGNLSSYSSPIAEGTTNAAGGADFTTRCATAIRCFGFDTTADLGPQIGDMGYDINTWVNHTPDNPSSTGCSTVTGNNACPVIDNTVSASGGGSIKFTIHNGGGSSNSGQWAGRFSTDTLTKFGAGQTFYVQWRQRFDTNMFFDFQQTGGSYAQWKQAILGPGDRTDCSPSVISNCSGGSTGGANELVPYTYQFYDFPVMYNSQTNGTPLQEPFGGDFKLQNAMASPYCLYSQGFTTPKTFFPPSGNCVPYVAGEWMTFQVGVTLGAYSNGQHLNSRVRLWVAREGQASQLVIDWNNQPLWTDTNPDWRSYGKVWLLPHMTGKDETQVHADAHTWYDELIISTNQIADPGDAAPSAPSAPSGFKIK